MPSLDQFFDRVMTPRYNCMDHAREVWAYLTGEDLHDRLPKLQGAFKDRKVSVAGVKTFEYLKEPFSPCIVLMQRPRDTPHVGVFYEGRVMQLGADGVEYTPLRDASRGFQQVRFYR